MDYSVFDQGRKKQDGDISAFKIVGVARKVHSEPGFPTHPCLIRELAGLPHA